MQTSPLAYVVGLGGIGTSALAQWLQKNAWRVQGTDRARSDITDGLERLGIAVDTSEHPNLPLGVSLLVFSDAVPPEHPLRKIARERGIRQASYPELLGELTRPLTTLAVTGSHGKSTTTSLLGLLLETDKQDPTVVVGSRLKAWGYGSAGGGLGNFRSGKSTLAVVEADEYRKHFLTLEPTVAVVTSVDHDHVDAFPTPAAYQAAYVEFLKKVRPNGSVVLPASDPATAMLTSALTAGVESVTFTSGGNASADVAASDLTTGQERQHFRLTVRGKEYGRFTLRVPGTHVIADAAAAVAATLTFRVPFDVIRGVLEEFRGIWRRFELVGEINGAPLVSDYAHHPTELKALLAGARQWYPNRRLLLAFQPHQKLRTRAFAGEFLKVLRQFDVLILAEVYDVAGREEESDRTTTKDWVSPLSDSGHPVTYAPDLHAVEDAVRSQARPGDAVLIVGAGDIDQVARRLARGTGPVFSP